MKRLWFVSALVAITVAAAWTVVRPADIVFQKHVLDMGANETCAFADINGDGRLDIVSGENWYAAPAWTQHRFRDIDFANNYIDNFSDLPMDVNGDGQMDIVSVSWFSRTVAWWKNPGKGKGTWQKTDIQTGFPTEFAFLVDLDNDGKALEVLPQFGDPVRSPTAWYEVKNGAFVQHIVNQKSHGHGIGAGDLNGDGRADVLTPKGWFEAPADPRGGSWVYHPEWEFKEHLSFMHVLDVNGDGKNDVISSNGHGYGIFWLQQAGDGKWNKHVIDDSWSQGHAVTLVDLNGDGRKDILTGKRYLAHNGKDPGGREPLGLYWYEYRKSTDGMKIEWTRHIIDFSTRAGGGMQIPVADLDGDGDLDFAAAGKSGLHLFENKTAGRKQASR